MNIAWTYLSIAVVALASATMIVGGETAKTELRFAEASVSAGATSGALGWLTAAATPATPESR